MLSDGYGLKSAGRTGICRDITARIQLVIEVVADVFLAAKSATCADRQAPSLAGFAMVQKDFYCQAYQYYFRWHGETGRMAASMESDIVNRFA